MDIFIAGAGKMASAIGAIALAGGHRVHIADRDPDQARDLANELGNNADAVTLEMAGTADVIVLAVPYPANKELAEQWSTELTGKTIVDIANPVNYSTFDDLMTPEGTSSAEEVAQAAPGANVVKAFNTTFAPTLTGGSHLDVFIAGDNQQACEQIAHLASGAGLHPIIVGRLKHARSLEGFQLLHIKVQDQIHGNWQSTLTLAA